MIRKTFIAAAVLLICYALFVAYLAPSSWSGTQHSWQDNSIRAEDFIYSEKDTFRHVMVGSSLSSRLDMRALPGIRNLSFAGHSVVDGMELILRSGKHVENLYIEANFPEKRPDPDFTRALFSPLHYPKKYVSALRDDNRPLSIIGWKMSRNLTRWITGRLHMLTGTLVEQDVRDQDRAAGLSVIRAGEYAAAPNDTLMEQSLRRIEHYVREIESRGTKVFFFELPVYDGLMDMPRASVSRRSVHERFREPRYRHIPLPDSLAYATTDGIHLTMDEGRRYAKHFMAKLPTLSDR